MTSCSPLQKTFARELRAVLAEHSKPWEDMDICVSEEFPIGLYRADFMIRIYRPSSIDLDKFPIWADLVVEVDGHEFHASKESLKHDHYRDAWIFKNFGASTLRFTGSEIYNDKSRCTELIVKFLDFLLRDCNTTRFEFAKKFTAHGLA